MRQLCVCGTNFVEEPGHERIWGHDVARLVTATAEVSGEPQLLVATVGALRYRGMAFLYAVPAGQR